MNAKQKTFLIDIDGTLVKHKGDLHRMITEEPEALPNVVEKFLQWRKDGHYIVLTTARAQGARYATEKQLAKLGIFYDRLIMGLTNGARVLINDTKPDGTETAFAYSIERDSGLGEVDVV
jgi:hydroxymethylpyrimidine pyrophosphatase-like HAD family hydrolase